MKKLENSSFVRDSLYVNPLTYNTGLVVARTFSPRTYLFDGKDESAWLPEIIICKPAEKESVKVTGNSLIAKSPSRVYFIQFNPFFNEEEKKGNSIFDFEEGFIRDENDQIGIIGNISADFYDATGHFDSNIVKGLIPYSGINNRNITFHGEKSELEEMLKIVSNNFPQREYDLVFSKPSCANGDKIYNIKLDDKEIDKFVKIASEKLRL